MENKLLEQTWKVEVWDFGLVINIQASWERIQAQNYLYLGNIIINNARALFIKKKKC